MKFNKFPGKIEVLLIIAVFTSLFTSSCLNKKVPNLERIFASVKTQKGKRPVIIIPGILGSELVNPKNDQRVWLDIYPVNGDNLSLPISPNLAQNRDNLEARRIIQTAKIFRFFPEVSVYQALISAMENYGGYQQGDWENPGADGDRDKYYVFAYDWRRDNVENAQLLTRKIAELQQKLNSPNLRFNVIAHSMGGLVARYAAMYGESDLPADGSNPVPNWNGTKYFNKIFMFGTPNEGSMDALKVLLNGYTVGRFNIYSLTSDVVITSPAVFQLLPQSSIANFYDEDLNKIDVDLYNPETWKKYSWSAYTNPNFLSKFKDQPNSVDKKGNPTEYAEVSLKDLDDYFANVLNRAKAFHNALSVDTTAPSSIGFFAFGGDCDETQNGAILIKNPINNYWTTIFSPRSYRDSSGKKVLKKDQRKLLFAPGDGRVTRNSLLASNISQMNVGNPIFRKSLPVTATFFCESHDELPNNKIMQDNFLTALLMEIVQ